MDPTEIKFERRVQIVKLDRARHLIYGVVYAPDEVDTQDDFAKAEEIEKGAHTFLLNGGVVGLEHKETAPAAPVETYIAPCDFELGEELVTKGSWVLVTKVFDDALWAAVERGEITGYSMAGKAKRLETEAA